MNSGFSSITRGLLLLALLWVPMLNAARSGIGKSTENQKARQHLHLHRAHMHSGHRLRHKHQAIEKVKGAVGGAVNGKDNTTDDEADDDEEGDDEEDEEKESDATNSTVKDQEASKKTDKKEKEAIAREEQLKAYKKELEQLETERFTLSRQADRIEEQTFKSKIDRDVARVSEETETEHLGPLLGDIRRDMWNFAAPFYLEEVEDKMDALKDKEADIKAKMDKLNDDAKAAEDEEDGKEKKLPPKAEEKKVKKLAEAPGGPIPKFTKETMPPVSPTLQCVINLSWQYFIIYTALAILRTINQFTGGAVFGVQKAVEGTCITVTFAPMLSVLFVGTRMRAIQLTQGETEKYKLPQPWVQNAMFVCTFAVLIQAILVLTITAFTGQLQSSVEGGELKSNLGQAGAYGKILSTLQYLATLALYVGVAVVIYGIFVMKGPEEIWGPGGAPPVSPAVSCTINLTVQFFFVYIGVMVVKTIGDLAGTSPFLTKLGGLLTLARFTVNFAPMLCILFIGARMRALQMDPKNGNPQKWAQNCFFLCTYSIMLQTILIIVMPFATNCTCKQGPSEGDVLFVMDNKILGIVMTVVRYCALLALYGGFTAVMVSVFVIEHPKDVSLTPPISPAMQCVMNLTVQYFTIYLALFVCITIKQFAPGIEKTMSFLIAIFEAGQKTVMFAPMLSILFIAARMRALQLTMATDDTIPPSAGPQSWAQQGMFLATWSVLVQVIMTIVVPIALGTGKPEMDESGNLKTPQGTNKIVGAILDTIRYLCLLSMYGGAVTVMYAVYTMTPETLPPYADHKNLIPGVDVPKPPAPPTPGF